MPNSQSRFLSNRRCALVALLLVTLVFVAACGSQAAPLTEESLKNAEYQGIYEETKNESTEGATP